MDPNHSVTQWLGELSSPQRQQREQAAQQIWQRYSDELLRVARQQLGARVGARVGASDVVQAVAKSFFEGLGEQLPHAEVANRGELRALLVAMTRNKLLKAVEYNTRKKNSIYREGGQQPDDEGSALVDRELPCGLPSPQEHAYFNELIERLLKVLPVEFEPIILGKLANWTNQELADKLGCVERTIERKLRIVRMVLMHLEGHSDEEIASVVQEQIATVQRQLGPVRAKLAQNNE